MTRLIIALIMLTTHNKTATKKHTLFMVCPNIKLLFSAQKDIDAQLVASVQLLCIVVLHEVLVVFFITVRPF